MKSEQQQLNDMVDAFAARMKEKLQAKYVAGWSGWNSAGYRNTLHLKLINHAMKGIHGDDQQWLDVANFAAFLDYQALQKENTE